MENNENNREYDLRNNKKYVDPNIDPNGSSDFNVESAAEVAAPLNGNDRVKINNDAKEAVGGRGIGWLALALSIISLFVLPIVMGAAGIIIGFIARRRGAEGLGAWAIGIGAVSIVIGLFIVPFF